MLRLASTTQAAQRSSSDGSCYQLIRQSDNVCDHGFAAPVPHPVTDRRVASDDIVYLDFGPVFDEWEAVLAAA